MAADLILALDQGTTSTRAALVDVDGPPQRRGDRSSTASTTPLPAASSTTRPRSSRRRSTLRRRGALAASTGARRRRRHREPARDDRRLGRATGRPVAPALVWQDARTADACARLSADGGEELVRRRTGLTLQPYFSATKLAWLLDNVARRPRPGRARRAAPPAPSTAGSRSRSPAATSPTSRTPRARCCSTPRACSGTTSCSRCSGSRAPLLPEVVPTWRTGGLATITAPGRSPACRCWRWSATSRRRCSARPACSPGEAKCTYGTGAFLLANAGTRRPEPASGLLASPAYQADDEPAVYCLEGASAVAGRAVGWLADELGILPDAAASAAVAADRRLERRRARRARVPGPLRARGGTPPPAARSSA